MDRVEQLLSDIKGDAQIMNVRFTAGFVNDAADTLERYGPGTLEAWLLEKSNRDELRSQANALLRVLDRIRQYPEVLSDRRVARLIIKALIPLKFSRR